MPVIKFTPDLYSPEELEESFVAREKLLEDLLRKIEESATHKIPRHLLLVGPRGIGKTHLILLAYYESKKRFKKTLIPIKFAEEEYSIYRLSDLFLRTLEELDIDTSEFYELEDSVVLEKSIEKIKALRDNKIFLLLLENLHSIFEQLGDEDLARLRSILQKEDLFMLIGTAPMIFEGITKHDKPFYNFFEVIFIKEFSQEEVEELVKKRAEIDKSDILEDFDSYRPRIKAITYLTGGSPRLILLLYEIISKSKLVDVEDAIIRILDDQTSYFQDVMGRLSRQQRLIIDTLISFSSPATPTELSRQTRLDVNKVNSQLSRLEQQGIVEKVKFERKKAVRYEVRERLLRIWREMRSPLGRKKISMLIEFLRIWYTVEELMDEFKRLEEKIKENFKLKEVEKTRKLARHLCYLTAAVPREHKIEIHQKAVSYLIEMGEFKEAEYEVESFRKYAEEFKEEKILKKAYAEEILLKTKTNKPEEALKGIEKLIKLNPEEASVWFTKGLTLLYLERHEEALESFDKCLELDPENAPAWSNKGLTLGNLERYEEALESFDKCLELCPEEASAWFNKGLILEKLNNYSDAIEIYHKSLKVAEEQGDKEALNNISRLYILASLHFSEKEAGNENKGNALELLIKALGARKYVDEKELKGYILVYLKEIAKGGKYEIVTEFSDKIIERLGEDYKVFLDPFIRSIDYIITKDVEIFETVQKERRETMVSIIKEITGSDKILPKQLR